MDLALIFGGIVVSILVQYLKNKFDTSRVGTLAIVAGLSIAGAVGYAIVLHFGWVDALIQIAVVAGAIYAFIFANLEKASDDDITP